MKAFSQCVCEGRVRKFIVCKNWGGGCGVSLPVSMSALVEVVEIQSIQISGETFRVFLPFFDTGIH